MEPEGDVTFVKFPPGYQGEALKCRPRNALVVLNKLVYLIEESVTDDCIYRQLLLFDEFMAAYTHDFMMQDLALIMRLLELLALGVSNVPQYHIPLQLLLEKAEKPPVLIRSSEKLECHRDLSEYFTLWGYFLLELNQEEYLKHVAKIILSLLNTKAHDKRNQVPTGMLQRAIEDSILPNIVAQLFIDVEGELYSMLLKVAIELALISPEVCDKMINERILDHVLSRLDPECKNRGDLPPTDPQVPTANLIYNLEDTTKLFWFLLQGIEYLPEKCRKGYPGICERAWWGYRYAFRILTKDKRAKLDRNFLTACLLKTLKLFPQMNFNATTLPDDFCLLCMHTEFEVGDTWASDVRHSKEILDYKFKKMILIAVGFCAKLGIMVPIKSRKVMPALFKLINPQLNTHWQSLQYCNLLHLALCICGLLVPNMLEDFINFDGPVRVLITLKHYLVHEYVVQILMGCLNLVWASLESNDDTIITKYKENDIMDTLLKVCNLILDKSKFTMAMQDCISYSFLIMEIFFKIYAETSEEIIEFGVRYLKRALKPNADDTVHDAKVAISCISCLWEAVKLNDENMKFFISKNGVYLLLDTIERSPSPVQIVGLGMLVDLCEEGSCIPYVITWRKRGMTYISLLLSIVRAENKKMKVRLAKSGVIGDIYKPLMGEHQYAVTKTAAKSSESSPSIMDMYGSSRPKVYAIIHLLRRHQNIVDMVNSQYKIQVLEPTLQDQITMLMIENFLALKLGEVWTELANDLKKIGAQPVGVDANLISTLTIRLPRWAAHIQREQLALLEGQVDKETLNEQVIYHKLKETRLADSLQAMHELHYIARTTESIFRMTTKMRQREYIDHANLHFSPEADHHNTFLYHLNVNPVYNQHVTIQSNVVTRPVNPIRPVSPECSDEDGPLLEDRYDLSMTKME